MYINESRHNLIARSVNGSVGGPPAFAGPQAIVILSIIFTIISITGILGNFLVVFVVLVDRAMRRSVTNILILNLAVSDFVVTIFGVPEIVQFMINRGWLLSEELCRFNRFIIQGCLYASIMTLVCLSIERYIAIIYPLKARILCTKRNILVAIALIWPLSFLSSSYTAIYNRLHRPAPTAPVVLCMTELPGDSLNDRNLTNSIILQYGEMLTFYFIPIILQVVLYTFIGIKLFKSTVELQTSTKRTNGSPRQNVHSNDALKARRSVIQMLIACVVVYVISYSPHQFLTIYNSVAGQHVKSTWELLVFAMVMAQVNSAANPILYCIISQKFRLCFKKYLCILCRRTDYLNQELMITSSYSGIANRKVSGSNVNNSLN